MRQKTIATRLILLMRKADRIRADLQATLDAAGMLHNDYDSARFGAAVGHLAQARLHTVGAVAELTQAAQVAAATLTQE